MADRVKYFLLGVLFLVVAGVIAYDRWNSPGEPPPQDVAVHDGSDTGDDFEMDVRPDLKVDPGTKTAQETLPAHVGPAEAHPEAQRQPLPDTPPAREEPTAAPRPDPKPAPVAVPDKTHVIRKGETLEAIAIKYYGTRDGIRWIVDANHLGNANRIFANQKLIIPAMKEITKEKGSGDAAPEKSSGKVPSRYRVKEGDGNLYAICRRIYGQEGQGARVSRVMELNHLWSADVKAGTLLILPPK